MSYVERDLPQGVRQLHSLLGAGNSSLLRRNDGTTLHVTVLVIVLNILVCLLTLINLSTLMWNGQILHIPVGPKTNTVDCNIRKARACHTTSAMSPIWVSQLTMSWIASCTVIFLVAAYMTALSCVCVCVATVLGGRELCGSAQLRTVMPAKSYAKLNLLFKALGHLTAVYCVAFDRTGDYLMTVSALY